MSEGRWIVCAVEAEGARGWRKRINDESGRISEEREGERNSRRRIGQKMEREGKNERCDRHLREPSKTPLWRKEGKKENWQQRRGSKRVLTDILHLMKSYLATSLRHEYTPRPDKHPAAELFMSENAIIRHTNVASGMRALKQHNTHTHKQFHHVNIKPTAFFCRLSGRHWPRFNVPFDLPVCTAASAQKICVFATAAKPQR